MFRLGTVVQHRVSRHSGCDKAGGRSGGISKKHRPAQMIARDSAAPSVAPRQNVLVPGVSSVRWAGTAAQVASPKMALCFHCAADGEPTGPLYDKPVFLP